MVCFFALTCRLVLPWACFGQNRGSCTRQSGCAGSWSRGCSGGGFGRGKSSFTLLQCFAIWWDWYKCCCRHFTCGCCRCCCCFCGCCFGTFLCTPVPGSWIPPTVRFILCPAPSTCHCWYALGMLLILKGKREDADFAIFCADSCQQNTNNRQIYLVINSLAYVS